MWRAILVAAALLLNAGVAAAAEVGFLDRKVTVDGVAHAFQVYVPPSYRPSAHPPAILALHGAGERGSDGRAPARVGLGKAIRAHPERFPAVVVFPQAPMDGAWRGGAVKAALAALDSAEREFQTDRSRTYLVGLSMGGSGAWYTAYNNPDRFAGLVVVCGYVTRNRRFPGVFPWWRSLGADDRVARRIASTPVWMAHGAADKTVSVDRSRRMVAALKAAHGNAHYVEFLGVGHESWDRAFDDARLWPWLFRQHR